jgi:hypothetical protein
MRLKCPMFTVEYDYLQKALENKGEDRVVNLLKRDNDGVSPVTYGDKIFDEEGN